MPLTKTLVLTDKPASELLGQPYGESLKGCISKRQSRSHATTSLSKNLLYLILTKALTDDFVRYCNPIQHISALDKTCLNDVSKDLANFDNDLHCIV